MTLLPLLLALVLGVVLLAAVTGPYPLPPAAVARAVVLRLVGAAPEPGSPVSAPNWTRSCPMKWQRCSE